MIQTTTTGTGNEVTGSYSQTVVGSSTASLTQDGSAGSRSFTVAESQTMSHTDVESGNANS